MTPPIRRRFVTALVLAAALSAGCGATINQVLADPAKYRDKDVKLSGSVSDSFSITNRGMYRLKDGTGELWVVSDNGVPRNGAKVTVHGTVREGFNVGALGNRLPAGVGSGIVLMETSHKAK
jgi:hypothetical protein